MAPEETLMLSGNVAGSGTAAGRFHVAVPDGFVRMEVERKFRDHAEALSVIMAWLEGSGGPRT